MIAAPQIEVATLADLEALAHLRSELGWHRSDPLLKGVLNWDRGRIFVVRAGELIPARGAATRELAATTSAIAAGPVGVIGNVAVRPEFRRRGLGGLLMSHALEWQRAQGVRANWLDATPAGRPLYRKLGFVDQTVSWYTHAPLRDLRLDRLAALADGFSVERAAATAIQRIAAIDLEAFGGDRLGLLHTLAAEESGALYIAYAGSDDDNDARRPLGYALTRRVEPPDAGLRLGPLVATNDAVAAALTHAIVTADRERFPAQFASGASFLTVGGGNEPAVRAFFDYVGATTVDDDLVMRLTMGDASGQSGATGDPGPHGTGRPSVYCWIAPMLF